MWDLFIASENLPFSVALTLMAVIALLEGATAVFGVALSDMVDALVPEVDMELGDGPDASGVPALSQFLGWLRFGQVPALILLIVFLLAFGIGGFAVQSIFEGMTGRFLGSALATVPALAIALPGVHFLGGALAAILPRDETEAVAEASFLGQNATIVLGTAQRGSPAQAKLTDAFGQTHYIMFEPEGDESLTAGTIVTLHEAAHGVFSGVAATALEKASDVTSSKGEKV
ncbi:MAG: YqiJ family protein [Gammaproteobacteria bacterium]